MRRSLVILIAVLLVVIIGGGLYFWLHRGTVKSVLNPQTNSQASANTPTIAKNSNTSLPVEIKGDKTLDATVKLINGLSIHFTSLTKADSFATVTADTGKTFIIVFFEPMTGAEVLAASQTLPAEVKLQVGKNTYEASSVKVASTTVKNDRGYLKFIVPSSTTAASLVAGSNQIKLPL